MMKGEDDEGRVTPGMMKGGTTMPGPKPGKMKEEFSQVTIMPGLDPGIVTRADLAAFSSSCAAGALRGGA
jgi:hypothetical protein